MSNVFSFPGLPINVTEVPQKLRHIVKTLYSYGYSISRNADGMWILKFPADHVFGFYELSFSEGNLGVGLLQALRKEEEQRGIIVRYEQFDPAWKDHRYGNHPKDTTMHKAGCGPTALAIVMQYLMTNGSHQRTSGRAITPDETRVYAGRHGRRSATATTKSNGTNNDKMINNIHSQWPEYDGLKIPLEEAERRVEEGWLIIFSCKGIKGLKRNRKSAKPYDGGHIMVLAGVEGVRSPKRLFNVLDPGRNVNNAMCFVTKLELSRHAYGFWWVYPIVENPVCTEEDI